MDSSFETLPSLIFLTSTERKLRIFGWKIESDGAARQIGRRRNKPESTRVFLTSKKLVPAGARLSVRRYVEALCDALALSPGDKDAIIGAAEVHSLARLWHPSHDKGGFRLSIDRIREVLRGLSYLPVTARILGSLYRCPEDDGSGQLTLERTGASVITVVDLLSETLGGVEPLSRDGLQSVRRGFQVLGGNLVASQVVDACLEVLERELEEREARERPNRVVIYSDKPHGVYALKTKLLATDFEVNQPKTLKELMAICRRRPPSAIVLRLHALPLQVIKTLQVVIGAGIPLGEIPTFLMVRSHVVHRLVSLLEMGIEDIVDVEGSTDMLISKIKKVRSRLELAASTEIRDSDEDSVSRGRLSDMNLIDLLQALGPSRRTVCVTVRSQDSAAQPLIMCLDGGQVAYAKTGENEGQDAISEAMAWLDGTWQIEQISHEDLPEPNNQTPNEALLMEGCRVLDETGRLSTA